MRISTKDSFSNNNYIDLKDQDWLDKQRIAGRVVAKTLIMLEDEVKNKTNLTLLELNEMAEAFIYENKCTPTFKNYKNFPAGVCTSVNKQLVHGIPNDYRLQSGDLISFDLGATYEGAIADSAITCIYGSPKFERHLDLVNTTKECLMRGISAIKVEKQLGVIGQAIYKYGRDKGYAVVTQYGGHGLSWDQPHSSPFVANKSEPSEGIRIVPGLAIAIEPMLIIGSNDTFVAKDGWTVMGNDVSAHFEHSIFVHDDHIEIITNRDL